MFDILATAAPRSMKEQNEPKLYAFTVFQLSLFVLIFVSPTVGESKLPDVAIAALAFAGLGGAAVASTVFTDLIPTSWKTKLTMGFVPPAAKRSKVMVNEHLSGEAINAISKIYDLPIHTGMEPEDVFGRMREYVVKNTAVYQAYKKYLLVREYCMIQIVLIIILSGLNFYLYNSSIYNFEYAIYMILTGILLVFTTISTERRSVQVVLKKASLVAPSLTQSLLSGDIEPRKAKRD